MTDCCCCPEAVGGGTAAVVGGGWGAWVAHEETACQPSSARPASAQRRHQLTGGGASCDA
ncbi:hypothetical protein LGH70_18440 [Hymenobacter sp. BT635]|uniref:Uncharacterized protein n=1 Tax=Hymenobacter nitidus TaxID=2880929 RepID=A0ABS8AI95_9BACT|nr:hypothetical protein [Hymenobacter nitidus]